MEGHPSILKLCITPRQREGSLMFYRKNKQTLESQRFYNLSVYYKRILLSKCPWSEKGTDFQTSSKLTSTLNIIPVSSARFQVSKLKSFSLHSVLVKSTVFAPIIGFFFLRCEFFSILNQLFNRRLILGSLIFRWFLSPWLV